MFEDERMKGSKKGRSKTAGGGGSGFFRLEGNRIGGLDLRSQGKDEVVGYGSINIRLACVQRKKATLYACM